MRIVIAAAGSRGDVAPYTGLGAALRQAYHDVTLAATDTFAPLAREAALKFRGLPADTRARGDVTGRRGLMRTAAAFVTELGQGFADAVDDGADLLLLSDVQAVRVRVAAMLLTTTSWLVRGLPRQFMVMRTTGMARASDPRPTSLALSACGYWRTAVHCTERRCSSCSAESSGWNSWRTCARRRARATWGPGERPSASMTSEAETIKAPLVSARRAHSARRRISRSKSASCASFSSALAHRTRYRAWMLFSF